MHLIISLSGRVDDSRWFWKYVCDVAEPIPWSLLSSLNWTSRSERRPHVDVYVCLPAGERRVQGSGSGVDKHKAERYWITASMFSRPCSNERRLGMKTPDTKSVTVWADHCEPKRSGRLLEMSNGQDQGLCIFSLASGLALGMAMSHGRPFGLSTSLFL